MARAGWRNFTSMVTGYELQDRPTGSAAEPLPDDDPEPEVRSGPDADVDPDPDPGIESESDSETGPRAPSDETEGATSDV